ncbi:RagB/SusD family nutrient uptake outer membrane protein [Ferruginibacter sp.]
MKYIKHINVALIAIGISAITFSSCKKDFYEIEDPNGLEVVGAFEDAGAVGLFLNRTYSLVMPQWPLLTNTNIHTTSDESNNANTAFLYGQLVENSVTDIGTSATNATQNRYGDIRRCNLAIDGLNASVTIPDSVKKQLKGQFFFLRAFTYFRMVRLYGGVPLVLKAQTLDEENLSVPRSKTSVCIKAIASDLDSAAAYLPASWPAAAEINKVTRAAALAVKGKTLLLWASPQFNITNDAVRWTDAYAACKVAYDACVADGYALVANYANILITEDHKEALLVRKYSTSRDLGHNLENVTRPVTESAGGGGQNQPTWNLAQAYTMNDGTPISAAGSGYNATQFWLNRDPRFNATIAVNGDVWALNGKTGRRQWSYTGVVNENAVEAQINTGFYCKRLTIPSVTLATVAYNSNFGGGNGMDWIEMRFAEVIANLAECANETGNLTEAKDMIRRLRQRAGIIAGANDYGLGLATNMAAMRTLILNERQVEFAMEGGMRYHDLRRTRNLHLITARQAYKVTPKLPYTAGNLPNPIVVGRIYLDVANALGFKPRDTANLNNPSVYAAMFNAPAITTLEGSNVISIPNTYYAYPLPNLFSQTPGIAQTIGWSGGTFDPYQ